MVATRAVDFSWWLRFDVFGILLEVHVFHVAYDGFNFVVQVLRFSAYQLAWAEEPFFSLLSFLCTTHETSPLRNVSPRARALMPLLVGCARSWLFLSFLDYEDFWRWDFRRALKSYPLIRDWVSFPSCYMLFSFSRAVALFAHDTCPLSACVTYSPVDCSSHPQALPRPAQPVLH